MYADNLQQMTKLKYVLGSMVILKWEVMREKVGPPVENCEAGSLLCYWSANKLACRSFRDAGRRHTLGL